MRYIRGIIMSDFIENSYPTINLDVHDLMECDCYSCNEAYKQILIEDDKIYNMSDEEIKKVYDIE